MQLITIVIVNSLANAEEAHQFVANTIKIVTNNKQRTMRRYNCIFTKQNRHTRFIAKSQPSTGCFLHYFALIQILLIVLFLSNMEIICVKILNLPFIFFVPFILLRSKEENINYSVVQYICFCCSWDPCDSIAHKGADTRTHTQINLYVYVQNTYTNIKHGWSRSNSK